MMITAYKTYNLPTFLCATSSLKLHPETVEDFLQPSPSLTTRIIETVLVTMDMKVSKSSFSASEPNSSEIQVGNTSNPNALQIAPLKTNSHFTDNTATYVRVG